VTENGRQSQSASYAATAITVVQRVIGYPADVDYYINAAGVTAVNIYCPKQSEYDVIDCVNVIFCLYALDLRKCTYVHHVVIVSGSGAWRPL